MLLSYTNKTVFISGDIVYLEMYENFRVGLDCSHLLKHWVYIHNFHYIHSKFKRNTLSFEVMCCNISGWKYREARHKKKIVHNLVCGTFNSRLARPPDFLYFAGKLVENSIYRRCSLSVIILTLTITKKKANKVHGSYGEAPNYLQFPKTFGPSGWLSRSFQC